MLTWQRPAGDTLCLTPSNFTLTNPFAMTGNPFRGNEVLGVSIGGSKRRRNILPLFRSSSIIAVIFALLQHSVGGAVPI